MFHVEINLPLTLLKARQTAQDYNRSMKFDQVMYGTDYPCWDPAACLKLLDEIELSDADKHKLFYANARRILGLRDPAPTKQREAALA